MSLFVKTLGSIHHDKIIKCKFIHDFLYFFKKILGFFLTYGKFWYIISVWEI